MRFIVLLTLCALSVAGSAAAAEKCPFDLMTCLENHKHLRERPWLGVELGHNVEGRFLVTAVEPKSPCQRAGVRVGDIVERIGGRVPAEWLAVTEAWRPGDTASFAVVRREDLVVLKVRFEPMPEAAFERVLGAHMAEAHLAFMRDRRAAIVEQ